MLKITTKIATTPTNARGNKNENNFNSEIDWIYFPNTSRIKCLYSYKVIYILRYMNDFIFYCRVFVFFYCFVICDTVNRYNSRKQRCKREQTKIWKIVVQFIMQHWSIYIPQKPFYAFIFVKYNNCFFFSRCSFESLTRFLVHFLFVV